MEPMIRRVRVFFALSLAAAIGLGIWLGWPGQPKGQTSPAAATTALVPARTTTALPSASSETPARMPERLPEPKPGEKSGGEMLEEWLSAPGSSDRAGLTIMQNFFLLPEKDHATAMLQLVNLVRDFNISGLERILLDPRTSLQAKEILYEDIKIRPDEVKFPIFLSLIRKPDHPASQDAREILSRILKGDWGTDYDRWEKEIQRYLKQS